ncbi:sensor histidine kinase [Amycolatopsis sp. FDAARGOS 1241]|uniref:sensor histidine kinase n=1 Tax=Amycolatopsis sp. FDAARGOS 1241 TaxID=2778070 RepID=UPI00195032ED|nr:sensor histidine kinase [Amycolatopsis sp. FDAARGOS 1241]QRP48897.1 sensor histidine kinase [Amycolatopsis sp. FDAARGOS 1241]
MRLGAPRDVKVDWRGSLLPPVAKRHADPPPRWHWWFSRAETTVPYVLLAVPTLLSALRADQTTAHRLTTLAIAAGAAGWLVLTTLVPSARVREHGAFAALTFAGIVSFGSVLEARETYFLIFMVHGFFAAMRMRPVAAAILGVAITSLLINTVANGGPIHALATAPAIWVTLVVVQTAGIGGGGAVFAAVGRESAERKRMLDQLAAAEAENRGLQRQLLTQAREAGVLDERQRLSEEIHDTLAQGFTGIITQLEAAAQAQDDPAEWRRHLDTATALARENLTAARRSVHALRPEPLEAATLPDALAEVARLWSERTGVPAGFTATGTPVPLHPELEATLLRITQEALSNVAKHARAGRAGLTLSYMGDEVSLDVRDDGVGFGPDDPAPGEGGFGLPGMRSRVQRLAGTLHVESEPGGGTAISVNLPAVPAATLDGIENEGASA